MDALKESTGEDTFEQLGEGLYRKLLFESSSEEYVTRIESAQI